MKTSGVTSTSALTGEFLFLTLATTFILAIPVLYTTRYSYTPSKDTNINLEKL